MIIIFKISLFPFSCIEIPLYQPFTVFFFRWQVVFTHSYMSPVNIVLIEFRNQHINWCSNFALQPFTLAAYFWFPRIGLKPRRATGTCGLTRKPKPSSVYMPLNSTLISTLQAVRCHGNYEFAFFFLNLILTHF